MVMIHRKWPSTWNSRYTGGLLLLLSMCLMSTISAMQQKLGPLGMLHPGNVLSQIHNDLSGALSPGAGDSSVYMLGKDISGGTSVRLNTLRSCGCSAIWALSC